MSIDSEAQKNPFDVKILVTDHDTKKEKDK